MRKLAGMMLCLTAMIILTACEQQGSPTIMSTVLSRETAIETNTPETVLDPTVTVELMPTLAGVVFSHDESLWQIDQDGKAVKVLDSFPDSYRHSEVSWDSKRIIFEQEMQLWVIDLSSGERESLTDGSQPLCCFGWVQGQSGIAYYAFKQPGSRDFEHYPITMTVAHLASDSLVILEEKQFNEVSRFASVSPNGYSLAYHDGDGAWIIQDDHSVEFFDAKTYGKNMPPDAILTNPAWSSDGSRIAWAISGTFGEEYETALVVFNLNSKTSYQLHQYDAIEGTHSIQWFRPQTVWSPDNNWIAFEASDAAFGDDNGVWAFGSNDMQKHHIGSMEVIGWSWDSEHLCHRFKDYGGYVDVPGWEEHRLTFLPFDNWRFIGWTTPVRNEL